MSLNDKVSYKKKPINFEEQVSFLEQKGLIIENKARALDYLQRIGYYRLKAYAIVFQIKAKDKCFNGTNMEQIIDGGADIIFDINYIIFKVFRKNVILNGLIQRP